MEPTIETEVFEGNARYSIAFGNDVHFEAMDSSILMCRISKRMGGFLIILRRSIATSSMLPSLSRTAMAVGLLIVRLQGCSGRRMTPQRSAGGTSMCIKAYGRTPQVASVGILQHGLSHSRTGQPKASKRKTLVLFR